jgi:hypothetical protein
MASPKPYPFFQMSSHPSTWITFLTPWIPLTKTIAIQEDRTTTKNRMDEPAAVLQCLLGHHSSKS